MIVFLLVAVSAFLIYRYTTRNHDYWAKRNVKHDRPLPFFGNHFQNFLVRRTVPEIISDLYNKYKGEKIVGYYRGNTPELIIRDPEIVKHILSVDFKNFPDRGVIGNIENDPLLHNMVFMTGERWRMTRQQLTPSLSRSKVRGMFPLQQQCIEKLDRTIEGFLSRKENVDAYDLMVGYTLESIGSCGFGVDLNTINSKRSNFTNLAKRFFVKTKPQIQAMVLAELLPEIASKFTFKIVSKDLERTIIEMTRKVREERNMKPSGRNDFTDILLELEAQGKLSTGYFSEEGIECNQDIELEKNLQFAAAQSFLLLIGGFETTATAMSTTLHQLAHHPNIQLKIQEDIDQVLSRYDNNITYESLDEMTLLEMAFKESMRLFAPFGSFRRSCVGKYTIPGTDVTIDAGVRILIPVQALHMDPTYFENPDEFRPERFSAMAGERANYKYLAFGEGPRKCIGTRLALSMSIAGLATILRRYTVEPASSSKYQLRAKNTSFLAQVVDGGLPLKFVARKT